MAEKHRRSVGDEVFDTSSLRASEHGNYVHRDYAAHFFRWCFISRFVDNDTTVLDVGCGVDRMMVRVLTQNLKTVPRRYLGVDLNDVRPLDRAWAETRGNLDFTRRWRSLGTFDVVMCLEVIEHMSVVSGRRLLRGLRGCCRPSGTIFLSTPVRHKQAANHIHEYKIDELRREIERAGLRVMARYGTFGRVPELMKVCTPVERTLMDDLGVFLSYEVLACFLAPKYPDASSNNVWLLKRR